MEEQSNVHGVGPLYFFTSTTKRRHLIERGWVREIDPPYRWGKGLRVAVSPRRTLEFGVCRRREFDNEYIAVREAVGGRDLEVPPPEIGDWNNNKELDGEEQQEA